MKRITYRFVVLLVAELTLLIMILLDRSPIYLTPLLFLLFIHLGLFLTFPDKIEIGVKRDIYPKIIFPGDEIFVRLSLTNKGDGIDILKIYENVDNDLGRDFRAIISLAHGESITLEYSLKAVKRGRYSVGPLNLEIRDPMGLVIESLEVKHDDIVILPGYESHGWVEMKSSVTGIWPGNVIGTRKGDGLEFRSVKEYSYGDQLRRINWKLTSKYDELMINEYEAEKVTDVILILDTSGLVKGDEYIVDVEVNAAASILYSLLRMGNRIGIITHGATRKWLMPGFGKSHFLRILEALSTVDIGSVIPLSNIVERLPRLMLKPGASILIVSPLLSIDTVKSAYILRMDGYRVSIISPFLPLPEDDEKTMLMNKIRNIERINNILWASRFHKIILYSEYISIREVLKEALK
jgi:uncharacterized protein (DUF58 family)